MKEKKLTWLILALTLVLGLFRINAFPVEAAGSYNVKDFGAKGNGQTDDTAAIQEALLKARYETTETTIVIPAGTYKISGTLEVYPYTTIKADGATIISSNPKGTMVIGLHYDGEGKICLKEEACDHGEYSQIYNVKVEGGTWDRNDADGTQDNQIFSFRHGQEISIKNAILQNCTNHMLNLSGVKNAMVENVTFKNHAAYTNKEDKEFWSDYTPGDRNRFSGIEAIHLDYMTKDGETAGYPFDKTPCRNITVSNCTFDRVFAGIGTHRRIEQGGQKADTITVKNNTFKNVEFACVDAFDFNKLTITDNSIDGAKNLIYSEASSSTISTADKTRVIKNTSIAMVFMEGSNATVSNNTIDTTTGDNGIAIENSTVTCAGNTIKNTKTSAIKGTKGSTVTVTGGTISNAGENGIFGYENNGKTITVDGVTITGPKEHGINVDKNTKLIARNNTISGVSGKSNGINVRSCDNAEILNNKSISSCVIGIDLGNAKNAKISGNTINATAANAVYIHDNSSAEITGNTINQPAQSGIRVAVNSTAAVSGANKINGPKQNGIYADDSTLTVREVTVTGAGIHGINAKNAALNANNNTIINTASSGIELNNCKDSKVANNTIKAEKAGVSSNVGVNVRGKSQNAEISGNKIYSTKANAIYIYEESSAKVTGNTIENAGGSGVRVTDSSTATVSGKNQITNPNNHGIWATKNSKLTADGNTITTPKNCGIYVEDCKSGNIINNNVIEKAAQSGIVLSKSGSGNRVENNRVNASGNCGIYLYCLEGCAVTNNKVLESKGHGIQAEGSAEKKCTVTIERNQSISKSTAANKWDIRLSANCVNCVVSNNTVGSRGFTADPSSTYKESGNANAPQVGSSYTVDKMKYEVTDFTGDTGTVELKGQASKTVKKATIPATVKIQGYTFNVTSIKKAAFNKCTKLTSVSIGKNVTSIGSSAFAQCTKLTKVAGCAGVTTVGSKAFYKCTKLSVVGSTAKTITLKKVESIGSSAFYGCKAVKKVNITSTALTKIGDSAFQGCTGMISFTEKSAKLDTIGKKAFYGDKSLGTISLKTAKLKSAKVGANAFKGIKSTCKFKVPKSKISSYKKIFKAKGAGSKFKVTKI